MLILTQSNHVSQLLVPGDYFAASVSPEHLLYLTQTDQCSAYSISVSTLEDLMVYFLGYEKLVCSKDIFGGHQYSYSSAVS